MWEQIDEATDRMKVPGGWIVRSWARWMHAPSLHQVFIADKNHTWEIKK